MVLHKVLPAVMSTRIMPGEPIFFRKWWRLLFGEDGKGWSTLAVIVNKWVCWVETILLNTCKFVEIHHFLIRDTSSFMFFLVFHGHSFVFRGVTATLNGNEVTQLTNRRSYSKVKQGQKMTQNLRPSMPLILREKCDDLIRFYKTFVCQPTPLTVPAPRNRGLIRPH